MDGGLLSAIDHRAVVIGTRQGRAMVAVSVPKLAANIGVHVFDGLLW